MKRLNLVPLRHRGDPVTPCPPPRPRTGGDKGVAPLGEDLHEVVSEVAAGQVETHDGVGQSVALIDGHVVGDAIPGVEDDTWDGGRKVRGDSKPPWSLPHRGWLMLCVLLTGRAAGGVEGEDGLDGDVHGGDVKGFEHDLRGKVRG